MHEAGCIGLRFFGRTRRRFALIIRANVSDAKTLSGLPAFVAEIDPLDRSLRFADRSLPPTRGERTRGSRPAQIDASAMQ